METLAIDPRLRAAVIPHIVLTSNLSPLQRLLIGILAMHGEVSFPGRVLLSRLTGANQRSVTRAVVKLEQLGWLKVERRRRTDGRMSSNRYILCVPDGEIHTMGQNVPRSMGQNVPRSMGQNVPINKSQNLNLKSEENNTGAAGAAPQLPPSTNNQERTRSHVHDDLLAVFDTLTTQKLGRAPARVWGRDRKIASGLIERYGWEGAVAVVKWWIPWRVQEGRVVTIPALQSAAEAVYQRHVARATKKAAPAAAKRSVVEEFQRFTVAMGRVPNNQAELSAWVKGQLANDAPGVVA
jgi:hypothetical protein